MATHNDTGNKAEELARAFLAEKGYVIRDTNWRYFQKEIDIIAEHAGCLVIVEVKSTHESRYENPSELLTQKKMRYITDAAEAYIFKNDIMMEVRFDLLVVIFSHQGVKIEHIESAFIPGVNW
ncbi:MAG TPA: YraN family protein [Bacteroidales bacterium]|nr:YraN family protein [Bacteroidales bacterium]